MENPASDIKRVVKTLTQGPPDEQLEAIYRYYAPGATFEHPFCRVPSFKNVHVPVLGELDSRMLIAAIYRWYKILSPKISLEIESCAFDEQTNIVYLRIFQIFSIWFIPFHRSPVSLVTALHLRPVSEPTSSELQENQPPPPPYHAAEEKLHAVQEGTEPSYASVAKGEASPPPSPTTAKHGGKEDAKSGSMTTRYYITKQEDLYQVNEFLKFVSMTPGAMLAGAFQLWATLMCLLGALVLGPFVRSGLPARSGKKEVKG
ncbi:uncharacterized protein B0T15DRAFT_528949 [Chaetomium strumarium]|uniref:SigF-like NTF2-like domain-containing protein n=1 Tax=Chaetomium strumarium TaxID=1170767 RepID=A0AAJ0GVP3_9PEZI|nr:hypothetical protein B0T15DRAFT_528949 [Chaetomium strumarium]